MPVVLYRVDERLIHGQVVVAWGARLHPDRIVVVDRDLAGSGWEQELYSMGVPPDVETDFLQVDEARRRLPEWREAPDRVIILTRDVATMISLAQDGLLEGEEVNLGGIHHAAGRRAVLPYVFLSEQEERELHDLAEAGAHVTARDLPSSRRVELTELLRKR
jgi:mannose/fructose/N-acetylgalactosamine-specific phosphotransferase system component IIB